MKLAEWLRAYDTSLYYQVIRAAKEKSLARAEAKRERRRARNLRWWAADRQSPVLSAVRPATPLPAPLTGQSAGGPDLRTWLRERRVDRALKIAITILALALALFIWWELTR